MKVREIFPPSEEVSSQSVSGTESKSSGVSFTENSTKVIMCGSEKLRCGRLIDFLRKLRDFLFLVED